MRGATRDSARNLPAACASIPVESVCMNSISAAVRVFDLEGVVAGARLFRLAGLDVEGLRTEIGAHLFRITVR